MTMPATATFTVGGHSFDLTDASFDAVDSPLARPVPPETLRFSFTCVVPANPGFDLFALPTITVPPLVKLTQPAGTPIRLPFQATSGKSRSGRPMYGCRQLRSGFWMPAPTKLERRRIRSWLAAFNRMHPPPVTQCPTSFDARVTGHTMKTRRDGSTFPVLHFEEVRHALPRPLVAQGKDVARP